MSKTRGDTDSELGAGALPNHRQIIVAGDEANAADGKGDGLTPPERAAGPADPSAADPGAAGPTEARGGDP
ncbi:MAG: hypothetical protein ABIP58_00905 [Dehalococcoidia bacterium]